jgi:hypothetical protein
LIAPLVAAAAIAELKHYLFWTVIAIVDVLAAFIAYRVWKRWMKEKSSGGKTGFPRE